MKTLYASLAFLILFPAAWSHAGRWHWSADIAALFVDYALALTAGLCLLLLGVRQWRWAAVAAVAVGIYSLHIIGGSVPATAVAGTPPDLRLMMYNIYYDNRDLPAILDEVAAHDPDVLFLMEYSFDIQAQIEADLTAEYPHTLIEPSRITMGVALFSRYPLVDAQIVRDRDTRIPIVQTGLQLPDGDTAYFVGGHPWPPMPQWGQLHRDQSLRITQVAADTPHPLIVAGDFNASQWSYEVRTLADRAGVINLHGRADLTKTFYPQRLIGLPLEHILVSPEWRVVDYRLGTQGGSDHLPLIVDLALP